MAEYIDREAVSKVITDIMSDCKINHKHRALNRNIRQIPTADVAEVRHGEWKNVSDYGNGNCFGYCSACGTPQKAQHPTALIMDFKYCRWCGAKMDGKGDTE